MTDSGMKPMKVGDLGQDFMQVQIPGDRRVWLMTEAVGTMDGHSQLFLEHEVTGEQKTVTLHDVMMVRAAELD